MKTNKLIAFAILLWLYLQSASASYTEVQCSSDPVFAQNTCNQCFNWWEKGQGEAFGFINDVFINKTTNSKLLYKEEQTMPTMINLWADKVSWSQTPSGGDAFWQYSKDFETMYSTGQEAYVIGAWKQVSRIESKDGFAYKLDKNTVARGQNVWLLVFSVISHDLVNGEVSIDTSEHKECVLFKSGVPSQNPVVTINEPVKRLPQTGPEHVLLVLVALLLGLWLFGLKRKNS